MLIWIDLLVNLRLRYYNIITLSGYRALESRLLEAGQQMQKLQSWSATHLVSGTTACRLYFVKLTSENLIMRAHMLYIYRRNYGYFIVELTTSFLVTRQLCYPSVLLIYIVKYWQLFRANLSVCAE